MDNKTKKKDSKVQTSKSNGFGKSKDKETDQRSKSDDKREFEFSE